MYDDDHNRGRLVRILVRCFVLFAFSSIAISFYAVFGTGFLLADLDQWLAVRFSIPAGLVSRLHLGLPWSATTELIATITYAGAIVSLTSLALFDCRWPVRNPSPK